MRVEMISNLCGGTLELQQHHGTGTLHDVEVEQIWLVPVAKGAQIKVVREDLRKYSSCEAIIWYYI